MRIKVDFSPNFSKKPRLRKDISLVIIHYTGMQSEIESLNRLKNPLSKVSCHYFINRRGEVSQLVKDSHVAWHAGKSKWKNFINLNYNSIGIELQNRGHKFGYQTFSHKQIKNLIILCKKLKKKYYIKKDSFLGHSDIAPLRKIDPGEKFPWRKLSSHNLGVWYKNNRKINLNYNRKNIKIIFFKNLKKLGYRYFDIFKRRSSDYKIIKSFQLRYLPKNVTGKIDKKTLKISHFLAN